MRTEERTVYIAEDDREFLSVAECQGYEARQALQKLLEREGVGRGGEWDQSMFRDFLVENSGPLSHILERIAATVYKP